MGDLIVTEIVYPTAKQMIPRRAKSLLLAALVHCAYYLAAVRSAWFAGLAAY